MHLTVDAITAIWINDIVFCNADPFIIVDGLSRYDAPGIDHRNIIIVD
jgi:hypothetical protein